MKIVDICKLYKKKTVLDTINFEIEENKFYAVLGASGSGKSTFLKIISGIETPTSGRIELDNIDITNNPIKNRNIGYIFQEPLLFPHMSVEDNVCYSLKVKKMDKDSISMLCDKYMKYLHIEDLKTRVPSELSGGQKQRVALARSLILSPKYLLLDEPFSSLDYNLRLEMGELLLKLQKELSLTIIFVTHDIEESLTLADKVLYLHKGKILESAAPRDIYYAPKNEKTALFMGDYNSIKGQLINNIFRTEYGDIHLSKKYDILDEVYIRPNKIQLIPSEKGKYSIEKIMTHGKSTRVKLKNIDLKIDTFFDENLYIGQLVDIEMISAY